MARKNGDANGPPGEQPSTPPAGTEPTTTRRSLITWLLGLGGTLTAAIVAVPALLAVATPAWRGRRREPWRRVGPLADFDVGRVQKAVVPIQREDWAESLNELAVYVWRRSEEEQDLVIYSRSCTDLSCPVHFDEGSECFFCPCHGGIFDKQGTPLAGPPRVPLYRYRFQIHEGTIEIDLDSV